MTADKKSAAVVRQDEGRVLRAFSDEIVIHLDGERTAPPERSQCGQERCRRAADRRCIIT